MKLKILLYGEYWEGTHVDCISRVLQERNIEHKIFDFYKILSPKIFNNIFDKVYRKLLYKNNERQINSLLVKEAYSYKPNVFFVSKGINIYPETYFVFKSLGIVIINWNPDDFFNSLNSSLNLNNSLNLYDFVFSSRKHLFKEYINSGINNPIFLDWYYIPWLHLSNDPIHTIDNKITFIGTHSKRRENILMSIDKIFPLEVWGAGWGSSGIIRRENTIIHKQELKQKEFPRVIAASRVNLNILTLENRDLTNLKIFEIAASNGLLLTEINESISEIFNDSCFYFKEEYANINESLNFLFDSNNTEYINSVRDLGHNKILEGNNSIFDRVDLILNTIKNNGIN
ncbi:glycosyltransferase family protein [Aquirufa antheringensis]